MSAADPAPGMPAISRAHADGNSALVARLVTDATVVMGLMILPLGAAVAFVSEGLLYAWTGDAATASGTSVYLKFAFSGAVANALSPWEVSLSWSDASTDETSFEIRRAVMDGSPSYVKIAEVGANETSYLDQDVDQGTSYRYRVRACSGSCSAQTTSNAVSPPTTAFDIQLVFQSVMTTEERLGFRVEGVKPVTEVVRPGRCVRKRCWCLAWTSVQDAPDQAVRAGRRRRERVFRQIV